jgi:hypothetical protein
VTTSASVREPPPGTVIPSSTARTSGTAASLHVNVADVGELVAEDVDVAATLEAAGAALPVVPLELQPASRSMARRMVLEAALSMRRT